MSRMRSTTKRLGWIVMCGVLGLDPARADDTGIRLVDATDASGVDFIHHTGAAGDRWLPETMGAGVIVFDADGGPLDLLFLDGHSWDSAKPDEGARLYRGTGDFRFEDITPDANLPSIYGMGGTAGDLDGDGAADLVLTALDGVRVLWGRGDGSFEDAQLLAGGWCTSTALLDYDRDGFTDIFVCRYVQWTPQTDIWCSLEGQDKTYCTPEVYQGSTCVLLRGLGNRTFADVSAQAGVDAPAKALGVICEDFDADGWIDVFVANDTMPDLLLRNLGGSFEDSGLAAGVALSADGLARAGMGVDAADYHRDQRVGIAVGHFSGEMIGLFRNRGTANFADEAAAMGLGAGTLPELTFGTVFCDLDLDGWPDLVTANGHIESEIASYRPAHRYRQRLGVYHNREGSGFDQVHDGVPQTPWVARGLAYGDLDADGDLDLILTQNGDRAILIRNELASGRGIRLKPNVNGASPGGVRFALRASSDSRPMFSTATLHLGSSYLSCSEPVVTFGLGTNEVIDLTVQWPAPLDPLRSTVHETVPNPSFDPGLQVETVSVSHTVEN